MAHYLISSQRDWLIEHARREEMGGWVCRATGKPINGKPFEQILHSVCCTLDEHLRAPVAPQDLGGEVRTVIMLWCTACGVEPTRLDVGDSDIIEVVG